MNLDVKFSLIIPFLGKFTLEKKKNKSIMYYNMKKTCFLPEQKRRSRMESVIEKLAEIEKTAEAIVEKAQEQKSEIEKEIQAKRDEFDRKLEEDTQKRLGEIRAEGERKVNELLEEERQKNSYMIENLKKEFEDSHTAYAQAILKRVLEV